MRLGRATRLLRNSVIFPESQLMNRPQLVRPEKNHVVQDYVRLAVLLLSSYSHIYINLRRQTVRMAAEGDHDFLPPKASQVSKLA